MLTYDTYQSKRDVKYARSKAYTRIIFTASIVDVVICVKEEIMRKIAWKKLFLLDEITNILTKMFPLKPHPFLIPPV